jgi:hypothetical protein
MICGADRNVFREFKDEEKRNSKGNFLHFHVMVSLMKNYIFRSSR